MGTYFLYIGNTDRATAFAFGDLDEINYIGRRHVKALEGGTQIVTVKLLELKSANFLGTLDHETNEPHESAVKREVTAFTGDADTAALVLKRRLAAERAEQANADQVPPEMPDQGSTLPA